MLPLKTSDLILPRRLHLAESVDNSSVSRLRVVVSIEQKAVVLLAPRVLVRNTPDGDTNALGDVEAGLSDGGVVVGGSSADVELGDGNLLDTRVGEGSESTLDLASGTGVEVGLGADAVDGDALGQPLLDGGDHALGDLGGAGGVEAVVVDVQLGVGVGLAGGAEGNANVVIVAEDVVEVRVLSESTVPLEDLVDDVLNMLAKPFIRSPSEENIPRRRSCPCNVQRRW
jgi:hypothetical protein